MEPINEGLQSRLVQLLPEAISDLDMPSSGSTASNKKNTITFNQYESFCSAVQSIQHSIDHLYSSDVLSTDAKRHGRSASINLTELEEKCSLSLEMKLILQFLKGFEPPRQPHTGEEELEQIDFKVASVFANAVMKGDLRTAQTLYDKHSVDLNGPSTEMLAAIHVACQHGHENIIYWLIVVQADLMEKQDDFGNRAIHHAVRKSVPNIVRILIECGKVDLDSQTAVGETALDIAVALENKECASLLVHFGQCNVNLKDRNGNTPLHRAAISGSYEIIKILTCSKRINWHLLNNERMTIIRLAIKEDALKIIEYFLKENADFLLDWVSHPGSLTAIHFAAMYGNVKVVQLFLNHMQQAEAGSTSPEVSMRSKTLLEKISKKNGKTAFLVACYYKSHAVAELMVKAGANLKAVDKDGNTAIILACLFEEGVSLIFKWDQDSFTKESMESHPLLSFLVTLIRKGCCWETRNKAGIKASDLLQHNGFPEFVTEFLDQMAGKWKRLPSGPNGCFGLNGQCAQQAEVEFSCAHKPVFKACLSCFELTYKQQKCVCPEENFSRIIDEEVVVVQQPTQGSSEFQPTRIKKELARGKSINMNALKWINDGTGKGYVKDIYGNRFIWNLRTNANGKIGYRCNQLVDSGDQQGDKRCKAVARRYFYESGEQRVILLELPHNHITDRGAQSPEGVEPGPSSSKRVRSMSGKYPK